VSSNNFNVRPLRRPEHAAPGRRWKTNWPGELSSASFRIPCMVLDISSWGAQVRVEQSLPEEGQVSLHLEAFGTIAAEIAWRRDNAVGLQFLEQQAAIRRLYSERLDPATWSPPVSGKLPVS